MFGDEIWCVTWQGQKWKGDLTRKQAEAEAKELQRGLCKHKDFLDYVDIKRDKETIREVDEMYKVAKRGERQTYQLMKWEE